MSGTINPLLWLAAQQDQVVGSSVPRYGSNPRELPTGLPEGFVYRGDIPTPPSDYGPTFLNMPHDYQTYHELLRPSDPPAYNQLLRLMYLNRDNRRA